MPKSNKNANQNGAVPNTNPTANGHNNFKAPVLQFDFIERRESTIYELDERVLEMIEKYPDYIESIQGKRPTADQVVEKGLFKVFTEDVGFQKFMQTPVGKSGARANERTVKETVQTDSNSQANAAQVG